MSGFSVLTNPQAASAVLGLNKTLSSLNQTQERINTGLRVGSAVDNASTFAIALGMKSDVAVYKTTADNLKIGQATIGVALSAGDQIAEELKFIKEKITEAANNPTGRSLIQSDIENSIAQIQSYTASAQFNGVNLIDGDADNIGKNYSVVASLDRTADGAMTLRNIDVAYQDLSIDQSDRGLGDLIDLNVKSSEVVQNKTDGMTSMVVTLTDPTAAGEIEFTYTDDDGDTRTLRTSHDDGTADDNDAVAARFINEHEDALSSVGITASFSATDGALTFTRSDTTAAKIGNLTSTGGSDAVGTDAHAETLDLDIQGGTLALNDEITINYELAGGGSTSVTLRVSESDTGAELEAGVYSLKDTDVAGETATALDIGNAIRDALVAQGDFAAGAAVAGTSLGLAVDSGGRVTISSSANDQGANNDAIESAVVQDKDYDALLNRVDAAESVLKTVQATLGSASVRLDSQETFMQSLISSVNEGIGTLVDANMAEESAKFQALQVQQQLGLQALSIANSQPQSILSLFR